MRILCLLCLLWRSNACPCKQGQYIKRSILQTCLNISPCRQEACNVKMGQLGRSRHILQPGASSARTPEMLGSCFTGRRDQTKACTCLATRACVFPPNLYCQARCYVLQIVRIPWELAVAHNSYADPRGAHVFKGALLGRPSLDGSSPPEEMPSDQSHPQRPCRDPPCRKEGSAKRLFVR